MTVKGMILIALSRMDFKSKRSVTQCVHGSVIRMLALKSERSGQIQTTQCGRSQICLKRGCEVVLILAAGIC
jgi:hypothetical protein